MNEVSSRKADCQWVFFFKVCHKGIVSDNMSENGWLFNWNAVKFVVTSLKEILIFKQGFSNEQYKRIYALVDFLVIFSRKHCIFMQWNDL